LRALAALLLGVAVAAAPALTYAQHGSGGGGHFGGGAHFGGGGHFSGGHAAGGGHFSGGHAAGGHYAGFGSGSHGYAAAHYGAGAHFTAGGAGRAGWGGAGHAGWGGAGHAGWGGRYGGGWYGGRYWGGAHYWGGGYWNGVFWPHIWFNPGWAWFLPVLPLGYATYWWGGVPYYYYNNLYYNWDPGDNGYVVADPPPVAGDDSVQSSGDAAGADYAQPPQPGQSAPYSGAAPSGGAAADVYLYPRNGQSDAQAQNDRYECHSWAVNQTGFDPTRPSQQASGSVAEYRRAMIACLDARGYSAR
jgi:hypothetical protein